VLLALLAERASGVDFHQLVHTLVCEPAGMVDTVFLRSDELSGRAARGYLSVDGLRTNVFHLPVLGNGDGGIYSTVADLRAFWDSLFAGRIVSPERVAEMVRQRSVCPEESKRYGLGFHLHATGDGVWLGGVRRGRVVREPAPALVIDHLHRHLELVRRCLADHQAARRAARHLEPTS